MRWISLPSSAGFSEMDWNPPSCAASCQHDDVDIVRQRVGEDVARVEAPGAQRVHQLVGSAGQLRRRSACSPDGEATTAG